MLECAYSLQGCTFSHLIGSYIMALSRISLGCGNFLKQRLPRTGERPAVELSSRGFNLVEELFVFL
jgi:hypothetical protein